MTFSSAMQGNPGREMQAILSELSDRDLLILQTRVLNPGRRTTLENLGRKFDVTRERIRQVEANLDLRMSELRAPQFAGIQKLACDFAATVGSAVPKNSPLCTDALARVRDLIGDSERAEFGVMLVLWLAGPYQEELGWYTSKQADPRDVNLMLSNLKSANAVIPIPEYQSVLNERNILPQFQSEWLNRFGNFVVLEDGIINAGGSFLDRAERLLRHVDRPMNPFEMVPLLGTVNVRGMRDRMTNDHRFWRVNVRGDMVLANTPGFRPYSTITKEIEHLIERGNGKANRELVVDYLNRQFGVSKSSVITFMNTPNFARLPNGDVGLRPVEDLPLSRATISRTRDCFKIDGSWGFRVLIDKDRRRGSGFSCPNAFAGHMGCPLGTKTSIRCPFGKITLSWRKDSPTGASMGSVKKVVDQQRLRNGDYLFAVGRIQKDAKETPEPFIDFLPLRTRDFEDLSGWPLAARLMGIRGPLDDETAMLRAILDALSLKLEDVPDGHSPDAIKEAVLERLRNRKERELLAIL